MFQTREYFTDTFWASCIFLNWMNSGFWVFVFDTRVFVDFKNETKRSQGSHPCGKATLTADDFCMIIYALLIF